ncbi:hypothetical protein [Kribbella kalugense]|uniref:RHIM domain-containing protein n=1 Tax=Kribbella kalugense TaxID=2512221 RepID=A0A4R7ZUL2_9ACTN|nr:hypothetical protein [Kribbella kalugense]TDW21793.1 hypothetical protein EV650_0623 [Kribbella kalugense]
MSDVVSEAAQVLVPLLAAGASTAVEEASKEAGKEFAHAVGSVVERIGKRLRGAPKTTELAATLQACVDDDTIKLADLKEIVRLSRARVGDTHVKVTGDNAKVLTDPIFNDPVTFN